MQVNDPEITYVTEQLKHMTMVHTLLYAWYALKIQISHTVLQ